MDRSCITPGLWWIEMPTAAYFGVVEVFARVGSTPKQVYLPRWLRLLDFDSPIVETMTFYDVEEQP